MLAEDYWLPGRMKVWEGYEKVLAPLGRRHKEKNCLRVLAIRKDMVEYIDFDLEWSGFLATSFFRKYAEKEEL